MSRGLSLTARLAALFAALTATLLVLAALLHGRMLDAHFHELDVHELHGKLMLIRNTLRQGDATTPLAARLDAVEAALVGHDNVGVRVRDIDGRVLRLIHPAHFTAAQRAGQAVEGEEPGWELDGHRYRGLRGSIVLPLAEDGAGGAPERPLEVLIALDLSHHTHFLASAQRATWAGVALAALVEAANG